MATKWLLRGALASVFATLALAGAISGPAAYARSWHADPAAAGGQVQVAQLPRQAQDTFALIAAGGPYPYEKDGVVFGNYERELPKQRRGYYHEYTVPTPGAHNRGARRIVCGGPARQTADCYYTGDHYASFQHIVE